LFVVDRGPSPAHPGTDQGDGVGVGGVGLAALSGGEDPGPGGQLRWHVDDLFTIGQQAGGDVPADALTTLDSPHPVRPPPGVGDHRRLAGAVVFVGRVAILGAGIAMLTGAAWLGTRLPLAIVCFLVLMTARSNLRLEWLYTRWLPNQARRPAVDR
jgi:hypothetical protein